jgi:DNA-3-methyladenine glycosylase I
MNRIWLITTNDNYTAVSFYQRRGFRVKTIHKNAIEQSRKLKPGIPVTGIEGVSIRDKIEMEIFI